MVTALHLLIPGLLGPWPPDRLHPSLPEPATPALAWWLTRADVHPVAASVDAELFQLFGLSVANDADGPVAAVTRLAEGAKPDSGWWWRADPVHFRADMNGVVLADARLLAIDPTEAAALVEAFNQTFGADGLQLDALQPDRWYLRLPTDPGIGTHALVAASGHDIRPLLPYGPTQGRWHTLLTEVQMLFYNHPVNQRREARNQPFISGIWLWGGGSCPSAAHAPAAGLYAHDPLTRGLARLADAAVSPVPQNATDWLEAATTEPSSLIVLDTTRFDASDDEVEAWANHLVRLEHDWFAPLRRLLQTGRLQTLYLYPGNGRRYTVNRSARWHFWHRPKSLRTYL